MTHLSAPTTLRRLRRIARQRGLTLVELMVALVVGLMVIMAAMSVFSSSSQSARTVDHAGQLRDDARFAADIIQRIAVQTGFEDIGFVTRAYHGTPQAYMGANGKADPLKMQAPISGLSGQIPKDEIPIVIGDGNGYTPDGATLGGGYNGTDTLVLRYHSVNRGSSETDADGSMMVCSGDTLGEEAGHSSTFRDQRAISIFYVALDGDGEPTLYCRWASKEDGTLSNPTPLVKGVESFKVLYGVDNILPETAADVDEDTRHAKLVPNRYLTADQMTVSDDDPATQTNWRRVRALRIGMVLRAAQNSGQTTNSEPIYPLGKNFGGSYTPVSTDTRLRQNYIFTVNVRNCLNQGYQAAGDPGKEADKDIPPCDVIVPCGEGSDRPCPTTAPSA